MTNPSTATSEKELIKLNKLFNVEFKNCPLKKLLRGQDLIKEYYSIYGTLEYGYVDIKGEIAYAELPNHIDIFIFPVQDKLMLKKYYLEIREPGTILFKGYLDLLNINNFKKWLIKYNDFYNKIYTSI